MFADRRHFPFRIHVEQVHEEVVGQRLGPFGEDAERRATRVGIQNPHPADENGHLWGCQREQVGAIDHQRFARFREIAAVVIAEAIRRRLENRKRLDVGLFLRSIGAARREGNHDVLPGLFRGLFDPGTTTENDQVCERNFLPADLCLVKVSLDLFENLQDLPEFVGLVDLPILLRGEANSCPVGPTAFIGTAVRRCRCPRGRNQLGCRQPRFEELALECRDVLNVDQSVIDFRYGILPHLRCRNGWPEQARDRPHVPVREFIPRLGEGRIELFRVLVESLGNLRVGGVHLE